MPNTRRIFPDTYVPPQHTFNLLLLAEGFTIEGPFIKKCHQLVRDLLGIVPFNTTRYQPSWINVYCYFTASTDPGPVLGTVPGNTVFGSTYDTSTSSLKLNTTSVSDVIHGQPRLWVRGEEGDRDHPAGNFWFLGPQRMGPTSGLIVILLPESVDGTLVSAEMESPASSPIPFFATTTDGLWHRVVARAMARVLGLGDEFERAGPNFLKPNQDESRKLDIYPNLTYLPAPFTANPPVDFKWYKELDSRQRSRPLKVIKHPLPVDNPNASVPSRRVTTADIDLVEGGGGYRTDVYRSAEDCLMRRQIGGALSPKRDDVPFCTICQRYLTLLITGTRGRPSRRVLRNQTLKFDEIKNWHAPTDKLPTFPQTPKISGFPVSAAVTGKTSLPAPFWEFKLEVGSPFGLRIRDLALKGQPTPGAGEDVAELIEFRDFTVTFMDDTTVPFDIAAAFNGGNAKFEAGIDGTVNELDKVGCHWGLKLTLEDDFSGTCPVRIEINLVLAGAGASIEPTGIIRAVKIFPQIGMTWSSGGSKWVKAFRGAVRLVLNNYHMPMHRHNIVSVLTDSNTSDRDNRKKPLTSIGVSPQNFPGPPHWADVFDYLRPNLTEEYEFDGVIGPNSTSSKLITRSDIYTWPRGEATTITLEKSPRQGSYDNVHTHGYMGDDPRDPAHGPMVHAPACGEACFHLHWRWGPGNPALASLLSQYTFNGTPEQFKGWGNSPVTRVANTVSGAPLIPPNQHLSITVAHPNTQRQNPNGPVLGSLPKLLDGSKKAIWYTVDISGFTPKQGPNPGERQVILEQGIGWGFAYLPLAEIMKVALVLAYPELTLIIMKITMEDLMQMLYSWIRWHSPGVGQIPEGTEKGSLGIKMEDL